MLVGFEVFIVEGVEIFKVEKGYVLRVRGEVALLVVEIG